MSIVLYLPRNDQERASAEREFSNLAMLWGVGSDDLAARRYPFSRMHAFAQNPDPALDPDIAEDVTADEEVASQFRLAVEAVGFSAALPMAAEDRNRLRERHGASWHIRILPADDPIEVLVEILLDAGQAPPTAMWLYDTRTRRYLRGIRLHPFTSGTSHLLLDSTDEVLRALQDPFVEVKLA